MYRAQLQKGLDYSKRKASDVTIAALTQVTTDHTDAASVKAQRRGLAFYCASKHYHPIADAGGFGDEARKVYDIWQTKDFARATEAVSDDFMKKFTVTGDEQVQRNYLQWMKKEGCYPIIYPLPRHSNMVEDHFITMRNMAKAAKW